MKTNVNMVRRMGDFTVLQRSVDGMFDATNLIKQWNAVPGNPQKEVDDFLRLDSTKEFISAIETEENLLPLKSANDNVYDVTHKSQLLKPANDRGYSDKVLYIKRGRNAISYMHPYLFIDFAMWINSKFKYQVIKFVYDELIKFRNLSGDNWNTLRNSTMNYHLRKSGKLPEKEVYQQNGAIIQIMMFGRYVSPDVWQNVSEDLLKVRSELELAMIYCYDNDFTHDRMIEFLLNRKKMLMK
jgi:hypothetical protein